MRNYWLFMIWFALMFNACQSCTNADRIATRLDNIASRCRP